jgi:hypothetical protein
LGGCVGKERDSCHWRELNPWLKPIVTLLNGVHFYESVCQQQRAYGREALINKYIKEEQIKTINRNKLSI